MNWLAANCRTAQRTENGRLHQQPLVFPKPPLRVCFSLLLPAVAAVSDSISLQASSSALLTDCRAMSWLLQHGLGPLTGPLCRRQLQLFHSSAVVANKKGRGSKPQHRAGQAKPKRTLPPANFQREVLPHADLGYEAKAKTDTSVLKTKSLLNSPPPSGRSRWARESGPSTQRSSSTSPNATMRHFQSSPPSSPDYQDRQGGSYQRNSSQTNGSYQRGSAESQDTYRRDSSSFSGSSRPSSPQSGGSYQRGSSELSGQDQRGSSDSSGQYQRSSSDSSGHYQRGSSESSGQYQRGNSDGPSHRGGSEISERSGFSQRGSGGKSYDNGPSSAFRRDDRSSGQRRSEPVRWN